MRARTDAPVLQDQRGLLCITQDGRGSCAPYYIVGTWDFGGPLLSSPDGHTIVQSESLRGAWLNEFGDQLFAPAWWVPLEEVLALVQGAECSDRGAS